MRVLHDGRLRYHVVQVRSRTKAVSVRSRKNGRRPRFSPTSCPVWTALTQKYLISRHRFTTHAGLRCVVAHDATCLSWMPTCTDGARANGVVSSQGLRVFDVSAARGKPSASAQSRKDVAKLRRRRGASPDQSRRSSADASRKAAHALRGVVST